MAASDERRPAADRFSEDPWEVRAAELEQTIADKNQQILRLETELDRRDERLKQALHRLRDAEEAVEAQVQMMDLAGALDHSPTAPMPPDTLSTIASEKGQLESRVKAMTSERDQAKSALAARDRELQTLRKVIDEQRRRAGQVEGELITARSRLAEVDRQTAQSAAAERDSASAHAEQLTDLERRLEHQTQARAKLEQTLRSAEEQAELYRANLLDAEESLAATSDERNAAQRDLEAARGRLEHVLRRAETLERRLAGERQTASRRLIERERLADHLRLAGRRVDAELTAVLGDRDRARRDARQQAQLAALARTRRDAEQAELSERLEDLAARLATAEAEATAARELCAVLDDARRAATHLTARTALVAEERATRLLERHGLRPDSALARATAPGKVGALLRWIRRS